MIIFYNFHKNPKLLYGFYIKDEKMPEFVWLKYGGDLEELKKREKLILKNENTAYFYFKKISNYKIPINLNPTICEHKERDMFDYYYNYYTPSLWKSHHLNLLSHCKFIPGMDKIIKVDENNNFIGD